MCLQRDCPVLHNPMHCSFYRFDQHGKESCLSPTSCIDVISIKPGSPIATYILFQAEVLGETVTHNWTKCFITFSWNTAKSSLEFNSVETMGRILTRTAKRLFPITLIPRKARNKISGMIYDVRFLEKKNSVAKQAGIVNEQVCPCSNICRVVRVFALS